MLIMVLDRPSEPYKQLLVPTNRLVKVSVSVNETMLLIAALFLIAVAVLPPAEPFIPGIVDRYASGSILTSWGGNLRRSSGFVRGGCQCRRQIRAACCCLQRRCG